MIARKIIYTDYNLTLIIYCLSILYELMELLIFK